MRLGDLLDRFEIPAVPAEGEDLPRAVGALGLDAHLVGRPLGTALRVQSEPRRRPVLKDLQPHDAVPGFDAPPFVVLIAVVLMNVIVPMPVVVMMVMSRVV
jgi:hypothetical protein